jgi:hypothetical protein
MSSKQLATPSSAQCVIGLCVLLMTRAQPESAFHFSMTAAMAVQEGVDVVPKHCAVEFFNVPGTDGYMALPLKACSHLHA